MSANTSFNANSLPCKSEINAMRIPDTPRQVSITAALGPPSTQQPKQATWRENRRRARSWRGDLQRILRAALLAWFEVRFEPRARWTHFDFARRVSRLRRCATATGNDSHRELRASGSDPCWAVDSFAL